MNCIKNLYTQLKITKNKPYRVNFRYKNKHYSIQECGELYEEYIRLICKEDKDFFAILPYKIYAYHITKKYGQTYKDSDLSEIKKVIKEYIDEEAVFND